MAAAGDSCGGRGRASADCASAGMGVDAVVVATGLSISEVEGLERE